MTSHFLPHSQMAEANHILCLNMYNGISLGLFTCHGTPNEAELLCISG